MNTDTEDEKKIGFTLVTKPWQLAYQGFKTVSKAQVIPNTEKQERAMVTLLLDQGPDPESPIDSR